MSRSADKGDSFHAQHWTGETERPKTDHKPCQLCGKTAYPSKREARMATRKAGNRTRVYRCGNAWHITNQDGKSKCSTSAKRWAKVRYTKNDRRNWRERS